MGLLGRWAVARESRSQRRRGVLMVHGARREPEPQAQVRLEDLDDGGPVRRRGVDRARGPMLGQ